jgi:hypothetical protein
MASHEPIVVERTNWRITKAACSCGEPLELSGEIGSPKEQSEKLIAAFKKHVSERQAAHPKPVQAEIPKVAKRKLREKVSQATARIDSGASPR